MPNANIDNISPENSKDDLEEKSIRISDDPQILQYLVKQHERVINTVDTHNLKTTQSIAINAVILSFIFDKLKYANSPVFFGFGIVLIILALILGVLNIRSREIWDSPTRKFYERGKTSRELSEYLLEDIEDNKMILRKKNRIFDYMVLSTISGLLILVISYYVK